jgi:hypothetical protein
VGEAVSYRLRIDLDDTSPPLWRRVEVPSTLTLDDLHHVVQVVFGWTDSHLHRFASAPEHSDQIDYYLSAFDLAEGDVGTPEEQVRLDQAMTEVGDRLHYQYDYGDNWWHTLKLEAVLPRDADAHPSVVCTDGRRPGPPEDCGGVYGYELIVGASDPDHPLHAQLAADFTYMYGEEVEPTDFDLVPFDIDAINVELAQLDPRSPAATGTAAGPLTDLLAGVYDPLLRRQLLRLVADADLDRAGQVDAATAARMVRPYRWLVERVGPDGIALTGAGYLPPVHVRAAVDELGLGEEWIGAGNREVNTRPVLHLRESSQELGLLRKHRGRLLTTARGAAVQADPDALWHHLAERLPLGARDPAEHQAGLVLLLAVAAGSTVGVDDLAAQVLVARGWALEGGRPLDPYAASRILWDNAAALRSLGALDYSRPDHRWPGTPTPDGMALARTALTTWPSGASSRPAPAS